MEIEEEKIYDKILVREISNNMEINYGIYLKFKNKYLKEVESNVDDLRISYQGNKSTNIHISSYKPIIANKTRKHIVIDP